MEEIAKNFKVLFIYPNTMMANLIPINLSILYPYLRSKGFQVELFDTTHYRTEDKSFEDQRVELLQLKPFKLEEKGIEFNESDVYEDLVKKVQVYKPNLIAITLVEDTFELGLSLLKSISHFDIPVVAGGVYCTNSPDDVISDDNIDMICIGEGEAALAELCEKLSRGKDYSQIKNLLVKKNGEIIKNQIRELVDLDKLPYLDYDIFERKRLYRPMQGKIRKMIHVEMDRGCPFSCTYCEAPKIKELYQSFGQNYYRRKSVERVMAELDHLVKKYDPDFIYFNAESFLAKPVHELLEFAKGYEKIGLPFWCQTRPETVSDEKVKILKKMNCTNVNLGIEHGNEEFRKKILNRHYSNERMMNAFKIIEKYKIDYTVNNIIGFPDETRELIFDTIEVNRQIAPSTMNVFMFTPYKGTRLYKYCLEKGYLTKNSKVHQVLDGTVGGLQMDTISYTELKGLQRTFPLYVKFPKSQWDEIRIAERFDEEGNRVFKEFRDIFWERFC
jgi:radical SAM superfamily enzyme YgiQ (UPF0313 family)